MFGNLMYKIDLFLNKRRMNTYKSLYVPMLLQFPIVVKNLLIDKFIEDSDGQPNSKT